MIGISAGRGPMDGSLRTNFYRRLGDCAFRPPHVHFDVYRCYAQSLLWIEGSLHNQDGVVQAKAQRILALDITSGDIRSHEVHG